MSEDKLSKWLSKEGLFGASTPKSSAPNQTPASKADNSKSSNNPAPQPKTNQSNSNRPSSNNRPNNTTNKSNAGGGRRGNTRFDKMMGQKTRNDPTFHRPTNEKRDKFHPINYIKSSSKDEIRVVPIGGMEQVGMNMMFLEWGDDIIIIDTGLVFPSAEHMGVDALIPDTSYLEKNKHKIKGVIYTHGHLDHIGGAAYILPKLGHPPIFATRLTKELLLLNSEEYADPKKFKITEVTPKSKMKLGRFEVEFFHVNHSIPDGVGIVVNTPYGAIVNTSDYKFDHNPADDQPADLGRIAELGRKGVLLAMSDSTNSLKPGQTVSESVIANDISKIITKTPGRIVMATFASNIGRVAKAVEAAEAAGRTVFLSGRSMERNIAVARKLNYLKCKDKTLQLMSPAADKLDPKRVMILSTGSQGETLAALTRMAAGVHPKVKLTSKDTVVFASSPIPGNEMAVVSVLNNLAELGCTVIDHKDMNTHVSGHGNAEECKLMCSLLNPKYFAPIHGEVYMRHGHRDMIVKELGYKKENTFVMKNGQGLVVSNKGIRMMSEKEAITQRDILVQLGETVHSQVIEDRKNISEYGLIVAVVEHSKGNIKDIKFRSKGFLFMDMNHEIYKMLSTKMKDVWTRTYDPGRPEKVLENPLKQAAEKMIMEKFRKETVVEVII